MSETVKEVLYPKVTPMKQILCVALVAEGVSNVTWDLVERIVEHIPQQVAERSVTDARLMINGIKLMYMYGGRKHAVDAIRAVKEVLKLDLKRSKDIVDSW